MCLFGVKKLTFNFKPLFIPQNRQCKIHFCMVSMRSTAFIMYSNCSLIDPVLRRLLPAEICCNGYLPIACSTPSILKLTFNIKPLFIPQNRQCKIHFCMVSMRSTTFIMYSNCSLIDPVLRRLLPAEIFCNGDLPIACSTPSINYADGPSSNVSSLTTHRLRESVSALFLRRADGSFVCPSDWSPEHRAVLSRIYNFCDPEAPSLLCA